MTRKSLPIYLLFVLLVLFGATQGTARMLCSECECWPNCNTVCLDDSGLASGCVNTGICVGSPACSGGEVSGEAADTDAFLAALRGEPSSPASACQLSAAVLAF